MTRWISVRAAALVAAMALASAVSGYAAEDTPTAVTLQGFFRFDHDVSTVRLDVRFNDSGRPRRVIFQAKDVNLLCDDGSRRRVPLNPIRMRVRRGGAFEAFGYSRIGTDGQAFHGVRGVIQSPRKATGRVMIGIDAPPGTPDCGTRGAGDWRASQAAGK